MTHQKDNNNKNLINKASVEHMSDKITNYYNVFDHEVYRELAGRSANLVTALYMVTDFLEDTDSLRVLVRKEMTSVMHELFMLTHSQKNNRVEILSRTHNILFGVLSYVGIIYENGFISDMNYQIVVSELRKLRDSIDTQLIKSLPYDKKHNHNQAVRDFTFSDSFFEVPTHIQGQEKSVTKNVIEPSLIKDMPDTAAQIKKTSPHGTVSSLHKKPSSLAQTTSPQVPKTNKSIRQAPKNNPAKEGRKENILKILKQKRDASINDICALFKDCSSKTIQRDLSELISEGLVSKEGSRRWSKYNLNY